MKVVPLVIGMLGTLAASGCATTGLSSSGGDAGGTSMIGGLVAGDVGERLNRADRQKALAAEYKALEYSQSGQSVDWRSDTSGRAGKVVPAQPYRVGSQNCRQYSHTLVMDGSTQTLRGTACRNEDGSWATLG